jgi:hypothetical protein
LKKALEDPETSNKLDGLRARERWISSGTSISSLSFNADEGNATGLGLSYQYARTSSADLTTSDK